MAAGPEGRARISACVIARDEEERLPGCLASIAFCDELIVVDSGSTDSTVELARRAGAHVVEQPWLGFASQRNVALDHAEGDWVLEVDADERVSPALATEILGFLESPPEAVDIGAFPIRQRFLGRRLGPSAKYPDYRHRLFRRGAYRHDPARTVHEGIWPKGPVEPFAGELEHELAGSLREAVRDAWAYARAEAAQLGTPHDTRSSLTGMLVRPPAKLVYRLLVAGGWRDGWRGTLHVVLECVSDTLVWARAFVRPSRARPGTPEPAGHFSGAGAQERAGPARVVAVARGQARAKAARWLERAAASGLDVTLVTDAPIEAVRSRTRVVPGLGPFRLARAVEAEHQLRPIDALVPAGRSERLRLCLVPRSLRGLDGIDLGSDPRELAGSVEARLRSRPAGT
jgi:Glycosyl transferase family 2